jgi:hypothetical protein
MIRVSDRGLLLLCFFVSLTICAFAQKGGGGAQGGQPGGQGAQAAPSGGANSGLQGLSFTPNQWPYMDLPNPPDPDWSWKNEGRVVVCYRLAKGNSATQPFVLEPIAKDDVPYSAFERPCGEKSEDKGVLAGGDHQGQEECKHKNEGDDAHWTPCTEFQKSPPALRANQMLVVGIDISDIGAPGPDTRLEVTGPNQNQLKLFNINVTNQQGSPLNPAPVRASFPLASAAGGGSGSAGALGIARTDTKGKTNGWQWTYMGSRAPGGVRGTTTAAWMPTHNYADGQIVSDATGRDFYRLDYRRPKRLALNEGAMDKLDCEGHCHKPR